MAEAVSLGLGQGAVVAALAGNGAQSTGPCYTMSTPAEPTLFNSSATPFGAPKALIF